jgi:uncharacterized protein YbbC (DUF1343 family)
MARHHQSAFVLVLAFSIGCTVTSRRLDPPDQLPEARVKPGITVLVNDSIDLIRGKKIGLLTNQTGINEHRESDIDVLRDPKVKKANVSLTMLFSPEHGIRGTKTGRISPTTSIAPPGCRSTRFIRRKPCRLRTVSFASSTRWWWIFRISGLGHGRTSGAMIYSMRAAARTGKMIIVLDRPNPITGFFVEGTTARQHACQCERSCARPAWARLCCLSDAAQARNDDRRDGAVLQRRAGDSRKPSRGSNAGMAARAVVRPHGTSVGEAVAEHADAPERDTLSGIGCIRGNEPVGGSRNSNRVPASGAPWLNAKATVALLKDRDITGVRFEEQSFTPVAPTDGKYPGQTIPGIRILITNPQFTSIGSRWRDAALGDC